MDTLSDLKKDLWSHPIYDAVDDLSSLRIFMEYHVVCVLDFMSLVKNLRNALTNDHGLVWTPPKNPEAARFINEIILDEESDDLGDGVYQSHFSMYCEAMEEIGADPEPVLSLLENLRGLNHYEDIRRIVSLSTLKDEAKKFCLTTFKAAGSDVHVLSSVFCHSREVVIPTMFRSIVSPLERENISCAILRNYLDRHIDVDESRHGPMADKLLEAYGYKDSARYEEAQTRTV